MHRRDVLRILATGTALQFAPRNLLTVLCEARAVLQSQVSQRTLNLHQEATVKLMAELILPRTETPGAADVGATEFIDLILTEWYEEPERTRFLNGLADVDSHTKTLFGKDFIDCSPDQQSEILSALGEKMIEDATGPSRAEHDFPADTNFYSMLRRLTLTAYYTSEAGATEELHFEVIPGRYQGCDSISSSKGAVEQK